MSQLENEYFAKLLEAKMKITCLRTFRYTQLPSDYGHLLSAIDAKLDKALTNCLITDILDESYYGRFYCVGGDNCK